MAQRSASLALKHADATRGSLEERTGEVPGSKFVIEMTLELTHNNLNSVPIEFPPIEFPSEQI